MPLVEVGGFHCCCERPRTHGVVDIFTPDSIYTAFRRLDPSISNLPNVAARRMHAPVRPHSPKSSEESIPLSKLAYKEVSWGEEVIGTIGNLYQRRQSLGFSNNVPGDFLTFFVFSLTARRQEEEIAGTGSTRYKILQVPPLVKSY